jgi:hypothetical protein
MGSAGELDTNGVIRCTYMTRCAMLILASTWERSLRMRKRAVGYNGRGRQNRPTNGHIPPVSGMAGSHRTLLNTITPTSAANVLRTFIYDYSCTDFLNYGQLTRGCHRLLTRIHVKDIGISTHFWLGNKGLQFALLKRENSIEIFILEYSYTCYSKT